MKPCAFKLIASESSQMNSPMIPIEVKSWLDGLIGKYHIISVHREHSAGTGVWKIGTSLGSYFLKLHKEEKKWHPEVYAYNNWSSSYKPYLPELVGVFQENNIQGVLVTAIDGVPLRDIDLPESKILNVYSCAGKLARNLHSSERGAWFGIPDSKGRPLSEHYGEPVEYMRADFNRWFSKALTLDSLSKRELKLAHWALDNVSVFSQEPPIPINEDYTPGNWLVNQQGEFVGVVDFECMYWGIEVDSFAILWERYFPRSPEAERAFFEGYGMNPSSERPLQVKHVCIKIGIADVVWGIEKNKKKNVELGRRILEAVQIQEEVRIYRFNNQD